MKIFRIREILVVSGMPGWVAPHRTTTKQLVRAMKLTAFILLTACLQVSARSAFSQDKITLSEKNATLETVLLKIEDQTGYQYVFRAVRAKDTKVTIEVKDATLQEVLGLCFAGQPFMWVIDGKTILVKEREEVIDPGKTVTVEGVVLNESGAPLSGASVTIKENNKSTITDVKGIFKFSVVPKNCMLIVSYIGYTSKEIKIQEGKWVQVFLSIAVNDLDKVVIQAYGKTSQRLTTSDITTVTAEEIEKQPIMNPLLALQGKVAGLDVTQTSGYASAPVKVELRGRSAISNNFPSDPLYIIDGVPLTIVDVLGNSGYSNGSTGFDQTGLSPAGGQSPLFSVNPNDIESIAVLKDADATAIYGSRGANGVILITTKKGKAGKTKFDLHIQEGVTHVSRFWDMLNTPQYLEMRRESFKNDQVTYGQSSSTIPNSINAYDLLLWDTTRYTDWQRALYGGMGKTIDAQAGISGGDALTTFRIGAGYNHTTNILTVSGADQRASLSFNLAHRSLDQRFSVSLTSSYSFVQSAMISLPGKVTYAPDAPAIFDSAGNLNFAGWGGNTDNTNARDAYPFFNLKQPYTAKTGFLNSNLSFSYQLARGLSLSTGLGYNNAQANQVLLQPIVSQDPLYTPTGSNSFGYNSNKNWIIEPQTTYDVFIGKGKVNALIGASYQQTNTDGLNVKGSGYTSDNLLQSISNAPNQTTYDSYGEYLYAALFGRITYSWENKYILNINGRRDGSSRFGANKQYGNFGSIGGAWIFTEEHWLKQHFKMLSFGKLRISYGTTGSDGVGDYQYLTRYSSNNTHPYDGVSSLVPTLHANPDFQWQVNKKLEVALQIGILKDRINLQAAYYNNRCGNQLVAFPTPAFSGFTSVTANSPALVQNDGWEFIASTTLIKTKQISWSINFNTAYNRNKLVAYPNFELSPYVGQYVIGQPLNIIRLLHYTGVDPQTGQYTFYDKNHNGQVNIDYSGRTPDDRYVYNLNPKFFGGLGMNFSYRSLQLSLFFNIVKQIGINAIDQGNDPGALNSNQPKGVLARWQNPGDITPVAAFTTMSSSEASLSYFHQSDGGYTDASFIRLSNLSISYNLPVNYVRKIGMQSCAFFFHINNLFVITKYKGIDPETQNFGSLPPTKIIVGGVSFNF